MVNSQATTRSVICVTTVSPRAKQAVGVWKVY
jgi:hypothetical protein